MNNFLAEDLEGQAVQMVLSCLPGASQAVQFGPLLERSGDAEVGCPGTPSQDGPARMIQLG